LQSHKGFKMNLLSYGGYHMCWPSANELLLLSANDIINECQNMELRFLVRTMMIACESTMKMEKRPLAGCQPFA
jgi:hypothetical protein